ncbi:MAG TPA: hypothetical protein VK427_20515 [Kofleriaceae bacterium]|nr:hypothetical protein [Kofleriaceae bacterium]
MKRLARAALPLALLVALAAITTFLVEDSRAELDNQVFTSRADRVRIVVPRGWRATDHPTYPGLLLWMMRTQPAGQIVLSSEAFTRELYCSWPVACRAASQTPTSQYACALRAKLEAQRLRVGPPQAGPKENEAAGAPSVWFEYDDGKRFLRQAIAVTHDRAISLVLSAPSQEARSSHVRQFDQALRTLRMLSVEEAATTADASTSDGASRDAASLDAVVIDAGFESAPTPALEPVGPCAK